MLKPSRPGSERIRTQAGTMPPKSTIILGVILMLIGLASLFDLVSVDASGLHVQAGSHPALSLAGLLVVASVSVCMLVIAAMGRSAR
jgi:hypothetical protein